MPGSTREDWKWDARDAEHLAPLALLGQITPVRVPGHADEAARDLVRAREDIRADLMRARNRISKLLLRHGLVYSGGKAWTEAHHTWLHRQHFENPALQIAFEASLEAAQLTLDRRNGLDAKITALAATDRYAPVVRALMCLRGISVPTAFGVAVEIGDWPRFTGSTNGAYLGLVPSEHSSGASRSLGGITKTGNSHAADCSWRPLGTTAGPTATSVVRCVPAGMQPMSTPGYVVTKVITACITSGTRSKRATNVGSSRTSPLSVNWPAGAGPSPPRSNRNSHARMNRRVPFPAPTRWLGSVEETRD